MASQFDQFASEFAAPSLVEAFGERNAHGDFCVVTYHPPAGAKLVELRGVIVGTLRIAEDEGGEGNGTHEREEQVQESELTISQPFACHMRGHFSLPQYGDPVFYVREIKETSPTFVIVMVERALVQRLKQRNQG